MPESKPSLEYVLILAAFAAGAVDIISFAKLGGIFASAMTGNLALLAFYLARGSVFSAIASAIALLGFIGGVSLGTLLARGRAHHRAVRRLLGAQSALSAAAAGLWFALPHRSGGMAADLLVLILAIAMGLQGMLGKKIDLSNIPTIVLTSTLTNIVTALTESLARGRLLPGPDLRRRIVAFLLYFAGAMVAGLLCFLEFSIVIFLPFAAIAAALLIHISTRRR